MSAVDYKTLRKEIAEHQGKYILDALRAYSQSKNILSGNGFEVRQLIRFLEDPANREKIWAFDKRKYCEELLGEVVRHSHNFLASIRTLVDHTRNLMKEDFISSEHRKEYQSKVNLVFATDPLAQFMQDFRDYITHYAVPLVTLTLSILPESEKCELNVSLDKLANWGGWTAPSRTFIAAHRPTVRIMTLVDDYENKAKTFHQEFVLSFQRYYEKEINEVLALMQESNEGLRQTLGKT